MLPGGFLKSMLFFLFILFPSYSVSFSSALLASVDVDV